VPDPVFMRKIAVFFIIVGLCSCIKELEYTVKHTPNVLVVNGVLKANNEINVHVSGLQSVLDTSLNLINNATILLSENAVVIDTMRSMGMGYYHSQKIALPENNYSLRVSAEGYKTVFASETVPPQTRIAEAKSFPSNTFDEEGIQNTDYSITMYDIPQNNSYFDFFIGEERMNHDSSFYFSFISHLFSSAPLFDETGIDYDMFFFSFLFSNQNINTQSYILNFTTRSIRTGSNNSYNDPILLNKVSGDVAVLRTVSKSYFDYRLSWNKHKMHQNDSLKIDDLLMLPLLGEPSGMYSNIENGMGVFIAYNQHYLKIE
jgi:hypothetical protein